MKKCWNILSNIEEAVSIAPLAKGIRSGCKSQGQGAAVGQGAPGRDLPAPARALSSE